MNIDKFDLKKRQMMVGVAKQLYDQGYTTKEVAAKMCLSESTVRSIKKVIDDAIANGYRES